MQGRASGPWRGHGPWGSAPLLDFHISCRHTSTCVPVCWGEPHVALPSRPPQNGGPDPQRGDPARSAPWGQGVFMGPPEPRSRSRGTRLHPALGSSCPAQPGLTRSPLPYAPLPRRALSHLAFSGVLFPTCAGFTTVRRQLPPHLRADHGRRAPGEPDLSHRWVALALCGRGRGGTLSSGLSPSSRAGHICGARGPTGRTLGAFPGGFRGPQLTGLSALVFAGKGLCGSQGHRHLSDFSGSAGDFSGRHGDSVCPLALIPLPPRTLARRQAEGHGPLSRTRGKRTTVGKMVSAFKQQRDLKVSLHVLASVPMVWVRLGRHEGGCGAHLHGTPSALSRLQAYQAARGLERNGTHEHTADFAPRYSVMARVDLADHR